MLLFSHEHQRLSIFGHAVHRTTITTDYFVDKSQQIQKVILFHFYPTLWRGGEGCPPVISGITPLDENFNHNFVVLTLKGE